MTSALHRLTVDFSTSDSKMAELLTTIRGLGTTPERLECEAHLYLALARSAWREADRLRKLQER